MNKIAIAFSTRDRVELTRQSIEPLLQSDKFDLFWCDGSDHSAGLDYFNLFPTSLIKKHANVRGGADAAIVYGLTTLLDHPNNYEFVGLVENDVLLHPDWFGPTMALFERGRDEGLEVGAVSARCYEDRILCQRDGYALCHNLGAGMVIFTRAAVRLVLDTFRTGYTTDNRLIFSQLSGLDIGRWWAFRDHEHAVTADWHFDVVLADQGLASLALTPSPCTMIGQVPPLAEQGLALADKPVELLRNDIAFSEFAANTEAIRKNEWLPGGAVYFQRSVADGMYTIFPHQFASLGAEWHAAKFWRNGDWHLKWSQGFGPFAWCAGEDAEPGLPMLTLPLLGAGELLIGGGKTGGKVKFGEDTLNVDSEEGGRIARLVIPPSVSLREIEVTCLTPGMTIYGLRTPYAQPWLPNVRFDHKSLPPV